MKIARRKFWKKTGKRLIKENSLFEETFAHLSLHRNNIIYGMVYAVLMMMRGIKRKFNDVIIESSYATEYAHS